VTQIFSGVSDGRPEIRCLADASAVPAVVARLHEGGVRSLTMTPPSLDDLFLQQYQDDGSGA
jgi:ABC-2 type transport system ATP-binding protein